MLGEIVFRKTTLPAMLKTMDAAMLRSRTIANNLANVNTPGYRRVEVTFEDHLRDALDKTRLKGSLTNDRHMQIGRKDLSQVNAEAYKPNDPTLASGVNNVDIDTEMAELAQTQIQFNFAAKIAKGSFNKINAAIQGKSVQMQ
jgi:flagellar basal-body rod protein FlgB